MCTLHRSIFSLLSTLFNISTSKQKTKIKTHYPFFLALWIYYITNILYIYNRNNGNDNGFLTTKNLFFLTPKYKRKVFLFLSLSLSLSLSHFRSVLFLQSQIPFCFFKERVGGAWCWNEERIYLESVSDLREVAKVVWSYGDKKCVLLVSWSLFDFPIITTTTPYLYFTFFLCFF